MPRIRTPATITQWYLFREKKTVLERKTGVKLRTIYNRIESPGEVRLSELGPLVKANDLTDEQIVKIVRAWE